MALQGLTSAELDHFLAHGFVHLRGCFDAGPGSLARRWVDASWTRAGVDPADPARWPGKPVVLPRDQTIPVREIAPRVAGAIADLLGGEDMVKAPLRDWGDDFLINYAVGADAPFVPLGPQAPAGQGWHVDGGWFRHFLDSPEQGLLCVVLWTDMVHRGGATCIAPDSVAAIARHLLAHPEGLDPIDMESRAAIATARDFRELTGDAGDVVLVHPLVMHRGSQNPLRRLRVISNGVSSQSEPLRLSRPDGAYTPVERVILSALGVPRIDFAITGQRGWMDPRRPRAAAP